MWTKLHFPAPFPWKCKEIYISDTHFINMCETWCRTETLKQQAFKRKLYTNIQAMSNYKKKNILKQMQTLASASKWLVTNEADVLCTRVRISRATGPYSGNAGCLVGPQWWDESLGE